MELKNRAGSIKTIIRSVDVTPKLGVGHVYAPVDRFLKNRSPKNKYCGWSVCNLFVNNLFIIMLY
jgi:hypothetical protein